jgi:DNA-directed RNA polymerase subunit L
MLMVDSMDIKFIEDEPKSLIAEFNGLDRSILDLIKSKLMDNKDVEFVGVNKEHPETGPPRLIVKSTKNARTLVLKAIEEVQDELKELQAQLPKKEK